MLAYGAALPRGLALNSAKPATNLQITRIASGHTAPSLADEVRTGLLAKPRKLPPKYFYDAVGAELFEQITRTPEYYPTRSELALLQAHGGEILQASGAAQLIELGSGSSRKTRALLAEAMPGTAYWPFDVSEDMLLDSAAQLRADFPGLDIHALVGDYTAGLAGLANVLPDQGRRLVLFLGGTMGNFEPEDAADFMRSIRSMLRKGDSLLLGVDRHKDASVLEAAYNDAAGVTAAFNRTVLQVINRELDADFDPDAFAHRAIYDAATKQIEMYLIARHDLQVRIADLDEVLHLPAGERICTEVSRKFDPERLDALLASGGLRLQQLWSTPEPYSYSLALALVEE